VPLVFLLGMTTWALILNLRNFVAQEQWVLAPLDLIIFVIALWLIVEAALALRAAFAARRDGTADVSTEGADQDPAAVRDANPDSGQRRT
jgi:carbon starvation protein